jgi:hypothetical protein
MVTIPLFDENNGRYGVIVDSGKWDSVNNGQ